MSSPAACEECGAGAPGATPRRHEIIHKPGCPVGLERARRNALRALGRATEQRVRAERELEQLRVLVRNRALVCDELEIPRTRIAEKAGLTRRRLYTILDGR